MKRSLVFALAIALFAACSTQEIDIQTPVQDDIEFYASFEQPADESTRVYANEDLLLRWTADDRVSIFGKNTYNQQYKFLGETGDNAGGFSKVDGAEYVTGNPISNIVSVYPYQEGTKITEAGTLTLNLPSEQHYAENTFGLGANTMVSVSEDNFLQYKNVGGYLRISLYGEGVSVSSISMKGNNGEKMAGKATVTMPLDGVPTVVFADDATDEIALVCDSPVALRATTEESKDFWFVIPPITFSKGFTITVTKADGAVFVKSTSKNIVIERSNLTKMSSMEVVGGTPVPEAIDLGLPSGLKWASFNLGASAPEEYGDYYAWGETEPKEDYSWSNYNWCMGTDKSMTKYCSDLSYGYNGFTDTKAVLDSEDDAASANLGVKWRMPTRDDWIELQTYCTLEWTSMNGIGGRKVTGPNGNSIFLPAAGTRYGNTLAGAGSKGYYLPSTLNTKYPNTVTFLFFSSNSLYSINYYRYYGRSIRPVYGEFISVESVSLNKPSLSLLAGSTEQLTVSISPGNATEKTVTWISNNTSVATVSSDGVVTAVSAGTAIITAWASDGVHFATCDVTVREQAPVPEAVDLGLSVKWASFNLGASAPEEYGNYYAWGETEPKDDYSWATYKWCMGDLNTMTKYCSDPEIGYNGFTDDKTDLDPEDDAAQVNLGGSWRMPTKAEWDELNSNCTLTSTTKNGMNGWLFAADNGNSIFIPIAGRRFDTHFIEVGSGGYYWSASLYTANPGSAWYSFFNSDGYSWGSLSDRYTGFSVRPVYAE